MYAIIALVFDGGNVCNAIDVTLNYMAIEPVTSFRGKLKINGLPNRQRR